MYFKINGPFGLNICFALELAWEAVQTGAPQTSFPLCCGSQAVSWFIHQENEVSWQKVWQMSGWSTAGSKAAGMSPLCIRSLRSCIPGGEILPFSQPKQLQESLQCFRTVARSITAVKFLKFHDQMGILLVLGVGDRPWASLDGVMSVPITSPGCLPVSPSLLWGYRCPRHTKGRPESTWQIENFFKPRSFKCKWNLVLASLSFQQE